jgi:hypothetical protein
MFCEFVVQNELNIHRSGEHIDGQQRKVGPVCYEYMECQQAAWTLAGVDLSEVLYVNCHASTNKFTSIKFTFHISLKVVELVSDLKFYMKKKFNWPNN